MKLLSVAIPCYNSAAYMRHCIESLLPGGDEVEILIVNDGSTKDNTGEIADEYEKRYPGICRAIHQENGGHGEAVNSGLRNATGVFFKVVDSDDWVNEDAYREVLKTLRKFCHDNVTLDMLITNFVYEKQGAKRKKVMNYRTAIPKEELIDWSGVKMFMLGQYILMHSVIYRTKLLRECGLKLPEHTFYVDNLFANCPLPFVQRIYYLNEDLYHYYLGREDQSVNEKVLVSRIDQQILVTQLGNRFVGSDAVQNTEPKLRRYLYRNSSIMMAISTIHLLMLGKEGRQRRKKLWQSLKKENPKLYRRLRLGSISGLTCLPGAPGAAVVLGGYRMARRIWQFQ